MYEKLGIYLTYGKKGAGKSLDQARTALKFFVDYERMERKHPELPKRIYFGNQPFSKEIEEKQLGVHLYYWDNAKQLKFCPRKDCWKGKVTHPIHDADIAWDEIGKDLPAGGWLDTPKWLRQIFSHCRKRGNRILSNTQVYADIDISFRRQIDVAYEIRKIFSSRDLTATSPPPKFIYGLIIKREFDPMILELEQDPEIQELKREKTKPPFPSFIIIRKKLVDVYDTQREIPAYKPDTLEHVELYCENEYCAKHGRLNKLASPRLEHYKI